ncbi:hypothetical protein OQJ18_05885 [Fluoribacter dumoffii]|uniref:Uncharacterized protein n=1 Tax=Fluoribacter dumoffii TaxID=463 RepID=A0A377G942_9GAMM|nr:hypothetical protein [Fluoribacter dumoffii]KTC90031.1 hypothetical protein Ldum_1099 [Fluoribacter dumoffii NY 23]MCW8385329.1 hypothetical protein [Fluoribacter dumoffii]MCW8418383.1 hypothetical protein [Fluoribacter dumoffii]MCW8453775.1 hypothetical protein [Fluoribacter dumoffii]MCW8462154.1 hypothetical protein [Fluoribacter dumoffii]
MTKFFDRKTKTLFVTGGNTNTADLSDNPLLQLPEADEITPSLVLRRQHAIRSRFFEKHYISTAGEEFHGNFDLKDPTNADLDEVIDTIYCP